jgi:hypothetical protein
MEGFGIWINWVAGCLRGLFVSCVLVRGSGRLEKVNPTSMVDFWLVRHEMAVLGDFDQGFHGGHGWEGKRGNGFIRLWHLVHPWLTEGFEFGSGRMGGSFLK